MKLKLEHLMIAIFGAGVIAVIAACGAGPSTGPLLGLCKKDYDPVELVAPTTGQKQFEIKAGAANLIPKGDYGYTHLDVYYHDLSNNVKVHISEAAATDGTFAPGLVCMSGFNRNIQPILEQIPIISDIKVDGNGQIQVRHRSMNFRIGHPDKDHNLWYTAPTSTEEDWVQGTTLESYTSFPSIMQYFNDLNPDATTQNYQLLTLIKIPTTVPGTGAPSEIDINILVGLTGFTTDDQRKNHDKTSYPAPAPSPTAIATPTPSPTSTSN